MEFLMGRSLTNALCNLGMNDSYATALREMGYELETLVEQVSSSPCPPLCPVWTPQNTN